LPNVGILTLEPGCRARTESIEFHAQSVEDSYISAFVPSVNFTIPKVIIPDGFEIKPLTLQNIDLDQFNKYSMQLEEANREIIADFLPFHQRQFNWTIFIFQAILVVLVLCIIVYIFFWFKKRTMNVLTKTLTYLNPYPPTPQAPSFDDQRMVEMPLSPPPIIKTRKASLPLSPSLRKSLCKSIRYLPSNYQLSSSPSLNSTNPYCA
jgi:hypothetical protein